LFGNDGTLYISGNDYLRAVTTFGSVKWMQNVQGSLVTPAIGYDGTIYYASTNAMFYALYTTGSIKWAFPTGGAIYSSPNIDNNGIIYFGSTDYNLYALHPSGSVVWSYYVQSGIKSSPAIGLDGTIYVGTMEGIMYAINPDGQTVWYTVTTSASFDISSPAISLGAIYICSLSSDYSLYAFDQYTGSIKWTYISKGALYSSPSITPGNDIIFSGSSNDNNFVYCISSTGSLVWRNAIASGTQYSSPLIGSDGKVYIAGDSLYAYYPSGSLQWITLFNVYPLTPILGSNGILYTGSGDTIYSVGTLFSTPSPSITPYMGVNTFSDSAKFQGNLQNTVFLIIF
jgi:outer membrane protein assembly factor BamB